MEEPRNFASCWVSVITVSRSSDTFEFFNIGKILKSQFNPQFLVKSSVLLLCCGSNILNNFASRLVRITVRIIKSFFYFFYLVAYLSSYHEKAINALCELA